MTSTTSSTPSSREFQPGDRVICIDADRSGGILVLDKVYTIASISPSFSERPRLHLSDSYNFGGFMPERFRLATNHIYRR